MSRSTSLDSSEAQLEAPQATKAPTRLTCEPLAAFHALTLPSPQPAQHREPLQLLYCTVLQIMLPKMIAGRRTFQYQKRDVRELCVRGLQMLVPCCSMKAAPAPDPELQRGSRPRFDCSQGLGMLTCHDVLAVGAEGGFQGCAVGIRRDWQRVELQKKETTPGPMQHMLVTQYCCVSRAR